MKYEFPLKPSRHYVCPPDAGPARRAAYESGIDMAELDDSLKLTPEERLGKNGVKRAEHFKRREFLTFLQRGLDLVNAHHVRTNRQ